MTSMAAWLKIFLPFKRPPVRSLNEFYPVFLKLNKGIGMISVLLLLLLLLLVLLLSQSLITIFGISFAGKIFTSYSAESLTIGSFIL